MHNCLYTKKAVNEYLCGRLVKLVSKEKVKFMEKNRHFKNLENMYLAGPINQIYKPKILVQEGYAEITMDVFKEFFHSGGALHGSVYFKMLDDAAFFAANSFEEKYFVLTTSFTTYLTRPVSQGQIKAVGRVVNKNKSQFITESILYDFKEREIARGSGIFVVGKYELKHSLGYFDK